MARTADQQFSNFCFTTAMSAPQKEPLFDIVQATHKAEQTTLWLHKMLRDTSLGLEKKLFAVDQSIVSRLSLPGMQC